MKKFCLFLLLICTVIAAYTPGDKNADISNIDVPATSKQSFFSASSFDQSNRAVLLESGSANISNGISSENSSLDYIHPGEEFIQQPIVVKKSRATRSPFFCKSYLLHIYPSHHFW